MDREAAVRREVKTKEIKKQATDRTIMKTILQKS